VRPIAENLEPTASSSSAIQQLRAYFELIKPSVTRMVLVTTLCGSAIAPGKMDWTKAGLALLGTAMVVGSANALNMVLERDTDALMARTASRPLPSGRLGARAATVFGLLLVVVGTLLLWFKVGTVAAWLAAIAHVIYVLVYTPLKRMTPLALHVGGIPGALPPVIGWASMTGHTGPGAWALFAILFMWQLPHFLAISIFRKDEYGRANICVFPNAEGIERTKRALFIYSVALLGTTLWPYQMGLGGPSYLVVAMGLGLAFAALSALGFWIKSESKWAKIVFFASLPYLVSVYGALVIAAA
jgi:protoheme IX farnesyltransferase